MIEFLKEIIIQAGELCLKEQTSLRTLDLGFKSKKDLVTTTDNKVEKFIIGQITTRFPDHGILGEETGRQNMDSAYLWIIDPIDGTTSFFHQQPFFSVSIALLHKGQPVCSAVFAPALNELFYATQDTAFLNDVAIGVSGTRTLIESVMATGFACLRSDLPKNNLPYFNRIVPKLRDIRRYGSAAIDLCYVACGRLDAFWELNLNLYDIAAGAMIVEKAGGKLCDFHGLKNYPEQGIIASNPDLLSPILNEFKPVNTRSETNGYVC